MFYKENLDNQIFQTENTIKEKQHIFKKIEDTIYKKRMN